MKICSHCGQAIRKTKVTKAKRRVAYVNASGKPVYFSKAMNRIMDAREAGAFAPVRDWLPYYLANIDKGKAIHARLDAPQPRQRDDETGENFLVRMGDHIADQQLARLDHKALTRNTFDGVEL